MLSHDTAPMSEWRQSWYANPASWYTLLGLGLLFTTLYVPWLTAERTARVERRAEHLGSQLLRTVEELKLQLDAESVPLVMARWLMLAERDGEFHADLETIDSGVPGALLTARNKHYMFQLAESPPPAQFHAGPDGMPAYEVVVWPRDGNGPGHAAYFLPSNAPRAYSRNLSADYLGFERAPAPGSCHSTPNIGRQEQWHYRSVNDERWILY
ncbi:MAG: hypothetical protein MUC36_12840 [Planctomycetes bacterium]|jgi:hypothetical protein|nr:hypothetical protein [Planctomycetota bacterium]